MHWFLDPIQKQYADFSGRATRQEYWMFALWTVLFYLFVGVVGLGFAFTGFSMLISIVIGVTVFALIVPSLAIQVRRLHDIGWSGWWILLSFLPYVGGLTLVVLFCLKSQDGTNKYGVNSHAVQNPPTENPVLPNTPSTPSV